jgi:hypothetical protein
MCINCTHKEVCIFEKDVSEKRSAVVESIPCRRLAGQDLGVLDGDKAFEEVEKVIEKYCRYFKND